MTVECAGAVYHVSAGLECRPYIFYYLALAGGAHLYVLQAPVSHCTFILAEHTFAGTGGIDCYKVKHKTGLAYLFGRVACNHHSRAAPFGHILGQNLGSASLNLIANQQTALWQQ